MVSFIESRSRNWICTDLVVNFLFFRPNAELYGTDHSLKHNEPNLPWNGFFTAKGMQSAETKPQQQLDVPDFIVNEFEFIPLAGHAFKEVLFYHKPSKSLSGLTDMLVSTDGLFNNCDNIPWTVRCYCFAVGLYRKDLPTTVGAQSYHLLFTGNQSVLQHSVNQLHGLDIQHIILGHGGTHNGKENCNQLLNSGFGWLLNHDYSFYKSLNLKIIWSTTFGFPV